MKIVPLDLKTANAFVAERHRHNRPVVSHKFSLGLEHDGELVGVAIAGRPVARMIDQKRTLEIRRVCVKDGAKNACSKLIARMKQIGQLMGYEKIITYTLQSESGASLRAVNARRIAAVHPGTWSRKGRPSPWRPAYGEWKARGGVKPNANTAPSIASSSPNRAIADAAKASAIVR